MSSTISGPAPGWLPISLHPQDLVTLERPTLVLDRSPVVPAPNPPPAHAHWGGDPQINVITNPRPANGLGFSIETKSSQKTKEDPPPDNKTEPKRPAGIVFEEIFRVEKVVNVKSTDGDCSIDDAVTTYIGFQVPPETGWPVGSIMILKLKEK